MVQPVMTRFQIQCHVSRIYHVHGSNMFSRTASTSLKPGGYLAGIYNGSPLPAWPVGKLNIDG